MRPRREAKPPRRPRVLTWRLVIVSLVVGGVLAVGSVVVCAVAWELRGVPLGRADLLAGWHAKGQTVLVTRYDFAGVTFWDTVSAPDADESLLRAGRADPRMRLVERDIRPAGLRTPMDGARHGRSSHRAGWPLRAAERTVRWDHATGRSITRGAWSLRAFGLDLTLPTLPLWPGLLGNTLFYGVLVLTPTALWRWRKLHRRARRGLCVACAYRLGDGVATCPECGLARAGAAGS